MTPITSSDSLFVTGLSANVLALLTWIVLREARGTVVNLWCVGGVNNMHRRACAIGGAWHRGPLRDGLLGTRIALQLTPEQLRPLQRSPA
jgi:hypothetical protein